VLAKRRKEGWLDFRSREGGVGGGWAGTITEGGGGSDVARVTPPSNKDEFVARIMSKDS
jgi:hypothetical protein